ncbi:MAG: DUF4397 domain-containing protein [Ilumatobacter sp.]|nr:DUF4397 domain-containing protein [Ilumatobacter sp.]
MWSIKKTFATTLVAATSLVAFGSGTDAQSEARIHLIHGIPGVDVDVAAGGANVFEGFSFGDTQDLSALAGQTLVGVQVKAAGTDTVAIDAGDVTLPGSGNYTVIAHLSADGTPSLGVFENDVSSIAAGEGRLTVRHTAAAPAVDVLADGNVAFAGVTNPQEGVVDLPVGTINASVAPAGTTDPVIGPADLSIADGQNLIVYAVGSLSDDSLTVLTETIDGLGTAPTRVNTGNTPIDGEGGVPYLAILLIAMLALAGTGAVVRVQRTA